MAVKNYCLVPSKRFLRDLEAVPVYIKMAVDKALLAIKKEPCSGRNIKKLSGVKIGVWRLRIGDWRIRYDVIGLEIRLHIIRHRKDVYREK